MVMVIGVMAAIRHRIADGRATNSADHSPHRATDYRSADRAGHASGYRAA
jgi:hypothetical protein